MFFYSTIIQKTAAHRFSPSGCPDGVEDVFSSKMNTFPTAERR